jgi:hypothetical protein
MKNNNDKTNLYDKNTDKRKKNDFPKYSSNHFEEENQIEFYEYNNISDENIYKTKEPKIKSQKSDDFINDWSGKY